MCSISIVCIKVSLKLTNLIADLWDNLRKLFLFIMENILKENIRSSTENLGNNGASTQNNFRFFDNRQKYLLFVSTCSEKEIISKRVGKEI